MIRKLIFFHLLFASVLGQNCDKSSSSSSSSEYFLCDEKQKIQEKCTTFALLRANSGYSSLSNLSSYLHISPSDLAEANGVSAEEDLFVITNQPLLIPIECKCNKGGLFEAEVKKTATKDESFSNIAEFFEGLTNCKAIREEKLDLLVPLKCACPSSSDSSKFLLSYPVKEGDTLSKLELNFNVSQESIVSTNMRYIKSGSFNSNSIVPLSTLLIPLQNKPILDISQKPESGNPSSSIKVRGSHKRKRLKKWLLGVYIAIGIIGFLACIAILAAFFFIHLRKKREINNNNLTKNGDSLELQQLSLSIRTTSDKKVSFEGSQYNFDGLNTTTTPHKNMPRIENYTLDELQKATEEFSVSNLIGGSVFHVRLKGKRVVIKRVPSDTISKIDFHLFQDNINHHRPNTLRLLGTCLIDGPDSYVVLEYAENGSLKDWIHGGLAIKSHFIASCSCFLNWSQRVKICLDVATALQHMHLIMSPCYVHMNIRSKNVFLDDDFSAKLGNFGMSNSFGEKNQELWDKGYLAPEYIISGTISPSIDIFAYGVVLLEVLSGKPPIKQDDERENGDLIKLSDEIKRILKSEDADELRAWIDGALGESYSFDGAVTLANLARSCVEDDPTARPNAGEIVEKLLRLVEELNEGDQFDVCESSCKPLVKAAANDM